MTENPNTPDPERPDPLTPGDPLGGEGAGAPPRDPSGGAPDPGGSTPPPPRPARRLTRSSSDRIIGGVAGGLGRYFGVDPILFRIAFVVLAFAGAVGLLAYVGLLAFVPSDDAESPGRTRNTNVIGVIVLGIAVVAVLGPPAFFAAPLVLPAALFVLIGLLVWRAVGGMPPAGDAGRLVARIAIAFLIGIAAVGAFLGVGFLAAVGGGVTMAVLAIVAGIALVATAFVGGARWLIVPALVLVLPVAIVAAADINVDGGVGDREYRPVTASDLRPEYKLGVGEMVLDLRDVRLPPGRTDLHVQVGVGHALVRVPENACVSSNIQVGAGYAGVLDRDSNGLDVAFVQTASPVGDAPQVHIDGDIGLGALDVQRGSEDVPHGPFWRGERTYGMEQPCP